jgi:cysteine-S-conjugate beta-lyase
MAYNFDSTPNRHSPHVHNKWTSYPNDVLPMWVVDMDFPSPKPILDELHKVVDQGVLGYETHPSLCWRRSLPAWISCTIGK